MPADPAFLEGIPLFAKLDGDERALLASVVAVRALKEGETLFKAGDTGDALFVVASGRIELSVRDTAGQKIVLDVKERGEVFGELSLLDAGPRTATAVALAATDLVELDRDNLKFLFTKKPDAALDMLAAMGAMTRKADALLRTRVSRNANEEIQERLTLVERTSDWISWFSGSMYFLVLNALLFLVWIVANSTDIGIPHWDENPYGVLTMMVSLEAIFLSIFVLISQNRQAAKDRVRSDIEYDINVKAELEVAHLHEKVDENQRALTERMARLEKLLEKR